MPKKKRRKLAALNKAPILIVQWLNEYDEKEGEEVWQRFHDEVELRFAEVVGRDEAIEAIGRWLHGNSNAQFLYLSTHGDESGLGPSNSNGLQWPELWDVLTKAVKRKNPRVALWLGACCSAYAAHAWSPVSSEAPVDYIVGFPIPIGAEEIGRVVKRLIKMTRLDPVTYVDEEIRKLRRSIPDTSVLMHYKAKTKAGPIRYVDLDHFKEEVGMTLKQYLQSKSSTQARPQQQVKTAGRVRRR
jgi:hypothetical protein